MSTDVYNFYVDIYENFQPVTSVNDDAPGKLFRDNHVRQEN